MKVTFSGIARPRKGALILFVAPEQPLAASASALDAETGGRIGRARELAQFRAKRASFLDVVAPDGLSLERIILVGTGDPQDMDEDKWVSLGGAIAGKLAELKVAHATLRCEFGENTHHPAAVAALLALGLRLRDYRFEHYKTRSKDNGGPGAPAAVVVQSAAPAAARRAYARADAVAAGVHFARDLINEPPNVLFPAEFAARLKPLAKLGVKIEILRRRDLEKHAMGALLAVAAGSRREPHIAVMSYSGGGKEPPVAFIGKGVTFDSGGLSLKPPASMFNMKGDMAGAACVAGLMQALAARKAKVNAVGLAGLVENMPDGNAVRPGDVVTTMSGQTIEVLNTDAEGRLVLADVLHYALDRFKPAAIVDLATLTGAIVVALGKHHAGLFANDDSLADRLIQCGCLTGERVWRMPLAAEYDELIDSTVADMKNTSGRGAGAITAAQLLARFVGDTPWAHLDIAGVAMEGAKTETNRSWGAGWGVRLLDRLVADHYESR